MTAAAMFIQVICNALSNRPLQPTSGAGGSGNSKRT